MKAKERLNNLQSKFSGSAAMSERDFERLSEFIHTECGIKMPPSKKTMLESRLQKRLRFIGISSFSQYCDFVFSPHGMESELIHMIDVVTTNKTDFFREPAHFNYLTQKTLPELISAYGADAKKRFVIWSAGCSTGEEPYTLAIVLSEFAESHPGFTFTILATDISTKVLGKAQTGIYEEDRLEPVPMPLVKKYFLKSKNKDKKLVRIIPELRQLVKFRRLNFMDEDFGFREPIDIVFCRNVIIYFDRPTQERLLNKFYRHMTPGGFIFMGHSETLNGLDVPLVSVAPTVYRKTS